MVYSQNSVPPNISAGSVSWRIFQHSTTAWILLVKSLDSAFRSFFGRSYEVIFCFRNLLTFSRGARGATGFKIGQKERKTIYCYKQPWIWKPIYSSVNIFLVVSMIWFGYTDKSYVHQNARNVFSLQKYHHHQQFLFKFKEKHWKCHVI